MLKRLITSIITLPALVVFLVIGGVWLQFAVLIVSLIGMNEFYTGLSKKNLPVHVMGYAYAIFYYVTFTGSKSSALINSHLMHVNALFIISLMIFLTFTHKSVNIIDCAVTIFGFYYVAVLLSFVYLVRMYGTIGAYFIPLIFICAFGSDTCALFAGKLMGKHKLTPTLSKKKTVEGAVGGVIGASLLVCLYIVFIGFFFKDRQDLADIRIITSGAIIGAVGSVFAQFGDLSASAVKRYANIKDFGKIMPGHGGILDRFDSVLFTAPGVYFALIAILKLRGNF